MLRGAKLGWSWGGMIRLEHKEQPENAKRLNTAPSSNDSFDSFVSSRVLSHSEFQFLYHTPMYSPSTSYPSN